ncbi:MAG: hypothetical protein KDB53_15230, partial [Planctomycetes bacterium]|nr:hypothetical protein [Planctomycetota bacterium]
GHDATLPLDFKVDVTAPVLACRIGGQSLSTAHAQPHAASSGDQDASNFVWARPPVALSGTVEDDSMVALHVNGHPVTIHPDGRTWNTSLDLKDGSHRIVIQATDGGGNVTTNHYDVRVDSVSPTVDIDGLAAEDRVNADRVALQIVARDDQRLAAVMIDGRPVEASRFTAGARFSHVLDGLAEGRNQLHVVARDAAGNETEELVSFLVDRTAPKGRVVLPIAGSTVAPGPVVVEVEVDDEDLSEVTINGATATSIGPRRFRITVAGAEGQSLDIAADCRDAAGNVGACPSIQCRVGVACQDCGGDKHCKHCDGEGQTRDDCTYCKDGLRTESCRPCSGQGQMSCSGCGGDGLIDEPCRPCGATGQVRCRNRHGRCVTCKGKKKIRPPRKRGDVIDIFLSLIPCGDCKGTGNAQCDLCNGSLWTTCGTCNGGKTRPERCRQCARSGPTTQCTHCHGDRSTQVTCNRPNCHGGQVSHDCPHCDRGACRSCEGRGYRE